MPANTATFNRLSVLFSFFILLGVFSSNRLAEADDAEKLWLDFARASITDSELHSHASVLADDMLEGREAGSRGGRAAAKYIVERIREAGLEPAGPTGSFLQNFAGNSRNILAKLPGTDPNLSADFVLIGAHYDHVGYGTRRNSYGPWGFIHNGADDNASGVATLLEIIDAVTRSGYQPRRSILFAFWDGEEKGLLGSKHWVKSPTVPLQNVKLAINIDMVGRLTEGRIEIGGTRTGKGLRRLMSSASMFDEGWLDFTWEYKENSDHWTFYQARIPSLYVHTGVHDDYHRPSDDVEKLNIAGMREVSRYTVEQLCELADADALPAFRDESRFDNPHKQKRTQKALASLGSRLGFQCENVAGAEQVRVSSLQSYSEAAKAGLRLGDQIISVNGLPCTDSSVLGSLALQAEKALALEIQRLGADAPIELNVPLSGQPVRLGLSWREDPAEPEAVYVTRVVPHSPADRANIALFDRVYALNDEPILGQADLLSRVQDLLALGADEFQLQIESKGVVREVVIPLGSPTPELQDATL